MKMKGVNHVFTEIKWNNNLKREGQGFISTKGKVEGLSNSFHFPFKNDNLYNFWTNNNHFQKCYHFEKDCPFKPAHFLSFLNEMKQFVWGTWKWLSCLKGNNHC